MNHKQLQSEEYLSILGIAFFFTTPRYMALPHSENSINQNVQIMQNKPNFSKSQMFITVSITKNYSEK
jgi:PDZ domain-containing secreted protein